MSEPHPRRPISGVQVIAIAVGVLVALAVLGSILGRWTVWIDLALTEIA